jgi:hypothetical protein
MDSVRTSDMRALRAESCRNRGQPPRLAISCDKPTHADSTVPVTACNLGGRLEVVLPPLVQPGLDPLNDLILLRDLFPPFRRVHLDPLRRLKYAMQPALLDQRLEDRLDRVQGRVDLRPGRLALLGAGGQCKGQWKLCVELDEVCERVEGC